MSVKRSNIAELNQIHPLNVLALECLQGYGVDVGEELAALTLIDAWWDELERSKLLKMNGGPRATHVRSALRHLSRADPTDAMAYLTEIDGKPSLDMNEPSAGRKSGRPCDSRGTHTPTGPRSAIAKTKVTTV